MEMKMGAHKLACLCVLKQVAQIEGKRWHALLVQHSHQIICVKTFWDFPVHARLSLPAPASDVHKMHLFHVDEL